MFRTAAQPAAVTEAALDVKVPFELIPLSVLSLDLEAPPIGWATELAARGVEIVLDDLGRPAIARADARQLFAEAAAAEVRQREVAERNERAAIEKDREFRAGLNKGIPWHHLPDGVSPAEAMAAADRATRPKRLTPLQEALSGESMTFHSFGSEQDEQ